MSLYFSCCTTGHTWRSSGFSFPTTDVEEIDLHFREVFLLLETPAPSGGCNNKCSRWFLELWCGIREVLRSGPMNDTRRENKTKRWRMMKLCDNLARWLVNQWHEMQRWARNAGWMFFERLSHFPRGYLTTFRCNKRVKQTVYSTRRRDGTARLELSTSPSLRGSIWFSIMSLSSSNGGLYGGFSENRKERKSNQ